MKKMIILGLLVLLAGLQILFTPGSVTLGPGVYVESVPFQTPPISKEPIEVGDFTITPMAEFQLDAKILSRKRYYFDYGAKLSPVDLALGWGSMSDEAVIDDLSFWQGNRYYTWHTKKLPIPANEITRSSANMHLIPATPEVRRSILRARKGEIISLTGKLVNISDVNGGKWNSSLSRNDSGSGACEVVWVEDFFVIEP